MQTGLWSCCFCDLECTSSEVEQGYWGCSAGLKDASSALPAVVLEPAAAQALLGMPAHAHAGLPLEQQQGLVKVGGCGGAMLVAVLQCCIGARVACGCTAVLQLVVMVAELQRCISCWLAWSSRQSIICSAS